MECPTVNNSSVFYILVSILNLAQPFGSIFAGFLSDAYGRRSTLIFSAFPMISGWILIALSSHILVLYIGRFLTGFAVGCVTTSIQVMIAETMEPINRDFMIGVPFVAYNLGVAFIYQMGASLGWRSIAWLSITMPAISVGLLVLVPESPMWMVQKGHDQEALSVLTHLRNSTTKATNEMNVLIARRESMLKSTDTSDNLCKLICRANVLKAIAVMYLFRIFVLISGALILVFYMPFVLSHLCVKMNCAPIGVYASYVRFLSTIICCMLLYYIGRRPFIITSSFLSGLFLFILLWYLKIRGSANEDSYYVYVTSFCLIGFCGTSASFMLMIGVMVGELMPTNIRGRMGGYNSAVFNFLTFGISILFPSFVDTCGIKYTIAAMCAGCFGIAFSMFFLLPETKNKPLSDIEDYFVHEKCLWSNRLKRTLSNIS